MKANRYTYLLLLLCACHSVASDAQGICSGSALVPVFKQTFGTSALPTSKNLVPPGFITNYAFNGSSALADGQYMVTPLVQNSQKNDWAVGGDHTGDVNGNMFLVNAGTGASLFFKQQVDNLCPGSTFTFSAWLANMNTASLTLPICGTSSIVYPNVTFYIKDVNGNVLKDFNTGNIPLTSGTNVPPNWQPYGFQFTLPSGITSLVLEMVDYYGGLPQCGNDLAIDDIMFSACTPQATITINTANTICAGSNTTISSSLLNSPFILPAYQWQKSTNGGVTWNNAGTPSTTANDFALLNVSLTDGAAYRVLVGPDVSSLSSSTCVTASNVISISVNEAPLVSIGSNSPVCVGSTLNLTANATGGTPSYTYEWAGPGFISSVINPVITNVNTSAHAGMYALTVTDANHCSASATASISVPPAPSVADAGPDQSVCNTNTITLDAVAPVPGVGSWSQVSGPTTAVFADLLSKNSQVHNLSAGVYRFRWSIELSPCVNSTDEVEIVIAPATGTGILAGGITVCAGSNNGMLTLSGITGSVRQWELSTDGGANWSVIANTTPSLAFTNLALTTSYRVLVQYGSCEQLYSNTVTATVSQPTQAGTLSGTAGVCASSNSGALTVTGQTGAILQWESSTDGGANWSVIPNTTPSFTFTNLALTTSYRVLVQNNPCSPQYTNTVTVTVYDPVIPGLLSGDAEVCASANTGNITLTGYSGTIQQWEYSTDGGASWTVINHTQAGWSYTGLTATTLYRVLVTSGTCTAQYSNIITITVDQPTAGGTVTGSIGVCALVNSGMVTLTGYTGNILQWESSSDNGTSWNVINGTGSSYAYNNLSVNTLFKARVQNGVCAAQYSGNAAVTTSPVTVPGVLGTDVTVCATSNAGTLSLTGYTGNILQWESSVDNGASWTTLSNTDDHLFYNGIVTPSDFRVLVQSGNCISQYSNTVRVSVNPPTVGGTVSGNATVCSAANSGMITLTGNTGSILHWESSVDNGNTWNSFSNTDNSFSYNNLFVTTTYRVLVQNGSCHSAYSNTVTISVDQPTVAGILSGDAMLCASSNSGILSLTGSLGNILQWESSIDNGNTWNNISNTANSLSYNNLSVSTKYRVSVQNGSCSQVYSNIIALSVDQPTMPGILSGNATACASANNGTISLMGNTGNILHWESSTDNGNTWNSIPNTGNSFSYNSLNTTTLFRVLVQNGQCSAQYSNLATITIDEVSVAGVINGDATVCASANSGSISLTGYKGNILYWESSADNGNTWSNLTNTQPAYFYHDLSSTTALKATVKNGVCPAVYSGSSVITVAAPVDKAIAGADQFLCNTHTIHLSGNDPASGTGLWTLVSGPPSVVFANNILYNTTLQNITPGNYLLEWRIANAVCADSRDTVSVTVYPSLINITDTAAKIICKGEHATLAGQPGSGGNNSYQYQWEKSVDSFSWTIIPNANTPDYSFVPDTTIFIRRSILSQSCTSVSGVTAIQVLQPVSNNSIAGDQKICAGAVIKEITGSVPLGGDGQFTYQWQQSTDGGASWNDISKAHSQHLPIATPFVKSTRFRRVVTTQNCAGPFSNISNVILIDVQQPASATVQYTGGIFCKLNTAIEFNPQTAYTDSIRWDFGDGTILTTTPQAISHVYNKPGTYLPSLQLINQSGCHLPVPVKDTIRVDEIKTGFQLAAVYDCGKTTYRFTDTSTSYFPVAKRIWGINQKIMGSERSLQYAFNSNGSNETSLQVNNLYGCTASVQAKFDVLIYAYPKVDINAVGQACLNNFMELKSVINSVDSVKSRIWNLGNGNSATDSVVQVSFFSEGKYIVRLTVSTINSCYDSAFKQLNIHPTPKISVQADHVVCKGDSVELKAFGASSYIWKDQDENIICSNCTTLRITPKKNVQYKVLGFSEFGCSEVASTQVRVVQPFRLTAKTADTLCAGDTKKIAVAGASSYAWRNDAGLSNYNSSAVTASPVTTTTYQVTGKDDYNCFSDTANIKITVGRPSVFSVGRDTSILSGVPFQLYTVTAAQDIRSWQWKGNATFSCLSCPAPTAKVIMDECLSCTATNIYGCKSTDTICITTFCPGSEVFIPNAFSPDGDGINDILFVQGRGIKLVKSFRVFSRWGEMVFEKTNFLPGDKSSGWDGRIRGKMAKPDVFVYVCEAICEKGTPALFKGNTAILK